MLESLKTCVAKQQGNHEAILRIFRFTFLYPLVSLKEAGELSSGDMFK